MWINSFVYGDFLHLTSEMIFLIEGYLVMMFWSGIVNRIIYAVLFFFTIDCVW